MSPGRRYPEKNTVSLPLALAVNGGASARQVVPGSEPAVIQQGLRFFFKKMNWMSGYSWCSVFPNQLCPDLLAAIAQFPGCSASTFCLQIPESWGVSSWHFFSTLLPKLQCL